MFLISFSLGGPFTPPIIRSTIQRQSHPIIKRKFLSVCFVAMKYLMTSRFVASVARAAPGVSRSHRANGKSFSKSRIFVFRLQFGTVFISTKAEFSSSCCLSLCFFFVLMTSLVTKSLLCAWRNGSRRQGRSAGANEWILQFVLNLLLSWNVQHMTGILSNVCFEVEFTGLFIFHSETTSSPSATRHLRAYCATGLESNAGSKADV